VLPTLACGATQFAEQTFPSRELGRAVPIFLRLAFIVVISLPLCFCRFAVFARSLVAASEVGSRLRLVGAVPRFLLTFMSAQPIGSLHLHFPVLVVTRSHNRDSPFSRPLTLGVFSYRPAEFWPDGGIADIVQFDQHGHSRLFYKHTVPRVVTPGLCPLYTWPVIDVTSVDLLTACAQIPSPVIRMAPKPKTVNDQFSAQVLSICAFILGLHKY
jgi:hypothetical protein